MKKWEKLEPMYNINLQAHTRKQVQMQTTAKIIAKKLVAKVKISKVSTRHFSYDTSYFATLDNKPITVERCADGEFTKYINNDGNSCQKVLGKSSLLEQLDALVHVSYDANNEKFLSIDLQVADYKLNHPEIATIETLIEAPSVEEFFRTGNLRETAINNFFTQMRCILT